MKEPITTEAIADAVEQARDMVARPHFHQLYALKLAEALLAYVAHATEPPLTCGKCGAAGEFMNPWDLCEDCVKDVYPEILTLRAANRQLMSEFGDSPKHTELQMQRIVNAVLWMARDLERTAFRTNAPEDFICFGSLAQEYRDIARTYMTDADLAEAAKRLHEYRERDAGRTP